MGSRGSNFYTFNGGKRNCYGKFVTANIACNCLNFNTCAIGSIKVYGDNVAGNGCVISTCYKYPFVGNVGCVLRVKYNAEVCRFAGLNATCTTYASGNTLKRIAYGEFYYVTANSTCYCLYLNDSTGRSIVLYGDSIVSYGCVISTFYKFPNVCAVSCVLRG